MDTQNEISLIAQLELALNIISLLTDRELEECRKELRDIASKPEYLSLIKERLKAYDPDTYNEKVKVITKKSSC